MNEVDSLKAENNELRRQLEFVKGLVTRSCDTCEHEVAKKDSDGVYVMHGCLKGYEEGLKCWECRVTPLKVMDSKDD